MKNFLKDILLVVLALSLVYAIQFLFGFESMVRGVLAGMIVTAWKYNDFNQ